MARRKQFSEFASGLVTRFVSRNNDIGGFWGVGVLSKALHDTGRTEVDFDLLGEHDHLDGGSGEWLRGRLAATDTPAEWLATALLRVAFTPASTEVVGEERGRQPWTTIPGARVYRAIATSAIVDDCGREWNATAETWCRDHDPRYELRSRDRS